MVALEHPMACSIAITGSPVTEKERRRIPEVSDGDKIKPCRFGNFCAVSNVASDLLPVPGWSGLVRIETKRRERGSGDCSQVLASVKIAPLKRHRPKNKVLRRVWAQCRKHDHE
jgi:hypothetical protein